eukprot:6193904-Pleurochrysis_carterae.AAC.1
MELKVVSPILTGQAPVPAADVSFAFVDTEPLLLTDILAATPLTILGRSIAMPYAKAVPSRRSLWRVFGSMAGHA